jgi:tetratricopeptide (TPR) repeat protein
VTSPFRRTGHAPRVAAAGLAAILWAAAAVAAPAPAPRRAPTPARAAAPAAAGKAVTPQALALAARQTIDEGRYAAGLAQLRALRPLTATDPDLELMIALCEARTGQLDSAWALLRSPLLEAAGRDSLPVSHWRPFGPGQEVAWLSGAHEGWHWYVVRARAELALRLGHWREAVTDARAAVRARPLSGRDHLLLAVAAGRAGADSMAAAEADRAVLLEPLLPEARDLAGLWAWRAGRREAARAHYEAAIRLDPHDRDAALALVRLRLPAAHPDSLPRRFLRGVRRAGMLIAAEGPKVEENIPTDQIPGLYGTPVVTVPDSVRANPAFHPEVHLVATALVSEDGRTLLLDVPRWDPARVPAGLVNALVEASRRWKFRPAVRLGQPLRLWINVDINLQP